MRVSTIRCRACAAVLPANAQWCSLCYADVNAPAARRAPAHATVTPAPSWQTPLPDIVAPSTAVSSTPVADATLPAATPDVADSAGAPARAEQTWPCPRCGERVPMSSDSCTACGAGFLTGATPVLSARLPVVGDLGNMSHTQRLLISAGISVVFAVVIVVVLAVAGVIL